MAHGLQSFEDQARTLGKRLRTALESFAASETAVLRLIGDMGAGKTTFVRALAEGLGVAAPQRVSSPTYTLLMVHDGPVPLVHLDLYRLSDRALGSASAAALESLGVEHGELMAPGQVVAIEWAEFWSESVDACITIRIEAVSADGAQGLEDTRKRALSIDLGVRWSALFSDAGF